MSSMTEINGHFLPKAMDALIKANKWKLPDQHEKLKLITKFNDVSILLFMSPELMRQNTNEIIKYYTSGDSELFGIASKNDKINKVKDGFLCYENLIVIAATYTDDVICLVYNDNDLIPEVFASDWSENKCRWKKIADDFDQFYNTII